MAKPRFSPALRALAQVVNGGELDLEVYDRFNEQYKPSDWTRNTLSDKEFLTFAINAMGSQYAFFIQDAADLDEAPIVLLGAGGETGVVASNIYELGALFAAGVDPSVVLAYGQFEAGDPSADLKKWLTARAGKRKLAPPKQILKDAKKKHAAILERLRAQRKERN